MFYNDCGFVSSSWTKIRKPGGPTLEDGTATRDRPRLKVTISFVTAVEIQKLLDEHKVVLDAKIHAFQLDIEQERGSLDEDFKIKAAEVEKKEIEVTHLEDKNSKYEHKDSLLCGTICDYDISSACTSHRRSNMCVMNSDTPYSHVNDTTVREYYNQAEFAVRDREPKDEVQIYTRMDAAFCDLTIW
nr:protein crowded nuclei 1-like [Tanacetum cinerariifolium]